MHFWSQYIILNNKNKKSLIKKVAHWKKDTTVFLYSSIQTRFRGNEETKANYFREHKSKCMSMRRHRASLFVEQSVFLPGRPKKQIRTNLFQIKPMTFCIPFTHEKWSSFRLTASHHDFLHTSSSPSQPKFKWFKIHRVFTI